MFNFFFFLNEVFSGEKCTLENLGNCHFYGPAVPINAYLFLAMILFGLGAYGVVTRRHLISILMCMEIMLNAVNLMLVAFSRQWGLSSMRPPFVSTGDELWVYVPVGQIFVIFSLTIAVAEAAIGLALVYHIYKSLGTTQADDFDLLKG